MALQGLRHSGNFGTDERPKSWRETILRLDPNGMAPLTGLTSLMKSSSVTDPEYNWFSKITPTQRTQLSGNLNATQTNIPLTAGALQLKAGHILRVEHSDELMFVAADPTSDTSVVVTRGFASTTPATVTVASENPFLMVIGTAHEEGSAAPTGVNYDPSKSYNYLQIFRNTLEMTRTARKTRLRTGDQVKEAKRECLELHGIEMEKAFIFGKRTEGTRNGKPFRTTGGLIEFIDSGNIVNNTDGTFSLLQFEEWLEKMFRYGSSEKLAFTGNQALLALNHAVRRNSSYNIQAGVKEFGMNVTRFTCPFGELVLKTHKMFNQHPTTAGASWNGLDTWLLVIDQANLSYRHLEGDDTRYEPKLGDNGVDGDKSGYLSECGLEVHHPLSHYLIKGLKSTVADGS